LRHCGGGGSRSIPRHANGAAGGRRTLRDVEEGEMKVVIVHRERHYTGRPWAQLRLWGRSACVRRTPPCRCARQCYASIEVPARLPKLMSQLPEMSGTSHYQRLRPTRRQLDDRAAASYLIGEGGRSQRASPSPESRAASGYLASCPCTSPEAEDRLECAIDDANSCGYLRSQVPIHGCGTRIR